MTVYWSWWDFSLVAAGSSSYSDLSLDSSADGAIPFFLNGDFVQDCLGLANVCYTR